MMDIEKTIKISKDEINKGGSGYKVLKVNVSCPIENLYAVCTPVKKQ